MTKTWMAMAVAGAALMTTPAAASLIDDVVPEVGGTVLSASTDFGVGVDVSYDGIIDELSFLDDGGNLDVFLSGIASGLGAGNPAAGTPPDLALSDLLTSDDFEAVFLDGSIADDLISLLFDTSLPGFGLDGLVLVELMFPTGTLPASTALGDIEAAGFVTASDVTFTEVVTAAVPVPASLPLALAGLGAMIVFGRRLRA